MNSMIQIILALVSMLAVAIAAIFGLKNKAAFLDLINKNGKVIDAVKDLEAKQAQNNSNLAAEDQKRNDLVNDVTKTTNSPDDTQAALSDFFNKKNQ